MSVFYWFSSSLPLPWRCDFFLPLRRSVVISKKQMFALVEVDWCSAGAFSCGAPPPLHEQVCVGDFSLSKRVWQVCCCNDLLTWRADDVRDLLSLATFLNSACSVRGLHLGHGLFFFWIAPQRTCTSACCCGARGVQQALQQARRLAVLWYCCLCEPLETVHSLGDDTRTLHDQRGHQSTDHEELWSSASVGCWHGPSIGGRHKDAGRSRA